MHKKTVPRKSLLMGALWSSSHFSTSDDDPTLTSHRVLKTFDCMVVATDCSVQ